MVAVHLHAWTVLEEELGLLARVHLRAVRAPVAAEPGRRGGRQWGGLGAGFGRRRAARLLGGVQLLDRRVLARLRRRARRLLVGDGAVDDALVHRRRVSGGGGRDDRHRSHDEAQPRGNRQARTRPSAPLDPVAGPPDEPPGARDRGLHTHAHEKTVLVIDGRRGIPMCRREA